MPFGCDCGILLLKSWFQKVAVLFYNCLVVVDFLPYSNHNFCNTLALLGFLDLMSGYVQIKRKKKEKPLTAHALCC